MENSSDKEVDSDPDTKIEEYDSDRVPESPPLFTQDLENYNIDEQGTQLPKIDSSKHQQGPSSEAWTSVGGGRKGSDVIIDIEYDDNDIEVVDEAEGSPGPPEEEGPVFPDEDDALLVSAAESAEASAVSGAQGTDIPEAEDEPVNTAIADMDPEMLAEEEIRKKEVEGFSKFEPMDKIFPDVRCSEYNTVAFIIKPNYKPMDPLDPMPPKCVMKWDPKYVPMPFCDENVVIVRPRNTQQGSDESGENQQSTNHNVAFKRSRVWSRIQTALSSSLTATEDIETVLRQYGIRMSGEMKALRYCIDDIMTSQERDVFFFKVIPFMTLLVLQTREIVTCPLPFLRRNVNHNISLSQKQIACLLANAFFCTFPRRFKAEADMASINFRDLFMEQDERVMRTKAQKIRCLIHYFTRIESDMPQGVVTYTRKNLRHSNMPEWGRLDKKLTKLIPLLNGTIEDDGAGMLKVDFANSYIGGGVLGRGAVQEEILFLIYPELILSRLFTEKMNSNEAIIITGCERFCSYEGYASSFKFEGDYVDTTSYDCKGRRCTQIVAIDALYISRRSFQYHPKHITRELNKAFVGFASPVNQSVAVATGKWGCGAFNGDPQLKAIIQCLAASHAGRDIAFFTFGDMTCLNDVLSIYSDLRNMKIKDVWNLLSQYHSICCSTSTPTRSLKEFCSQYAAGQQFQGDQDEEIASTSKKTKAVPITHFYPSEKREHTTRPNTEDPNVGELIVGMDKINTPAKSSNDSKGKRQREDEPLGLTEDEIVAQLSKDSEDFSQQPAHPIGKGHNGLKGGCPTENNASPKSAKRSKPTTLMDFYQPLSKK